MANETPEAKISTLVSIQGLKKCYRPGRWLLRDRNPVQALNDVDFDIRAGTTSALVGESGSGKSTLAKCIARLERADAGKILFGGRDIQNLQGRELLRLRRKIQLIFQDPASALNPRFSSGEIIEEPLAIQHIGSRSDRRRRTLELMEQVGLSSSLCNKSPMELSGGQRQRLAIARALAVKPEFLILDEAFAGLDLSIKAQLVNLLLELQDASSLTYLYISHDLDLVAHFADDIAVMHQGRIVEKAPAGRLFAHPAHPCTRALVESMLCVM